MMNDNYYIFSRDDIAPFFGLGYIKLLRKLGLEENLAENL